MGRSGETADTLSSGGLALPPLILDLSFIGLPDPAPPPTGPNADDARDAVGE